MNFVYVMIAATVVCIAMQSYVGKRRGVPLVKCVIMALITLGSGYFGAKLMRLVEAGTMEGRSFFGTVFLTPVVTIIAARLIRVSVADVLDATAVSCAFVAMFEKIGCSIDGCCQGRVFQFVSDNQIKIFQFPSQITESIAGLVIALILLRWLVRGRYSGKLYPLFLVLYGIARFVLNWLRSARPFIWFLPAGNFWSLISIAAGIVCLRVMKCRTENKGKYAERPRAHARN